MVYVPVGRLLSVPVLQTRLPLEFVVPVHTVLLPESLTVKVQPEPLRSPVLSTPSPLTSMYLGAFRPPQAPNGSLEKSNSVALGTADERVSATARPTQEFPPVM